VCFFAVVAMVGFVLSVVGVTRSTGSGNGPPSGLRLCDGGAGCSDMSKVYYDAALNCLVCGGGGGGNTSSTLPFCEPYPSDFRLYLYRRSEIDPACYESVALEN